MSNHPYPKEAFIMYQIIFFSYLRQCLRVLFLAIGQQNSCVVNDAYHSSNLALVFFLHLLLLVTKHNVTKITHQVSIFVFFQLSNLSLGLFQRQYVVEESQNWRRSNLSYQENKEWSFYCSLHWQWPAWWEELRVTLSKNLTRSLKKDDQAHSFIHLSKDFWFFQASIRSAAEVDAFGSFWYGPNQLFFALPERWQSGRL